jgi:hypothetical protein
MALRRCDDDGKFGMDWFLGLADGGAHRRGRAAARVGVG